MHSALNRLQTTFGYFTSCAFTLACIIALLSIIPVPAPTGSPRASISVRNVQVVKGRPHYYSPKREEYAQIRFDLDADLSDLFTWNTKQLFVYVTANYPSGNDGDGGLSEAVIWDTIIPATSTPYSWQNLKQKYFPDKKSSRAKTKSRRDSNPKSKTTDIVKPGVFSLNNQKPKYQITDPSGIISERGNATLHVSWNVQPWVGALIWDKGYLGSRLGTWEAGSGGRSEIFEFPPLKGSRTDAVKDKEGPKTPKAGSATPVVEI
ncbi:putative microsomal signal peptidase subunit (gp23) [Cladophialophora carrionii]|uniref:Signal peptidase subunit 3 n=1 Tax=Cladophialophora carrionii TaxID=86049 RepID=A0A1C1CW12_9EURO|nr:putative microsomal signal peptidase subunit (gp23) [Cladophialophora carrionii]